MYKILIKDKETQKTFTYTTNSYKKENGFIEFYDKNNKFHSFPLDRLDGVLEV